MSSLNRRYFLKTVIVSTLIFPLGILLLKLRNLYHSGYSFDTVIIKLRSRWRFNELLDSDEKLSIRLYVDLLIPEDSSPGALSMGIDEKIFSKSVQYAFYRRQLREGIMHLKLLAKKHHRNHFYSLNTAQANHIIMLNEKADQRSTGHILFSLLRHDSFNYYYSNADHWQTLCYQGPPQPRGFLNPNLAPEKCNHN